MEMTRDSDTNYVFTSEPVITPPNFGQPRFKIGTRVKLVMTTLNPMSRGKYDGICGVISVIVFCKSDGRTILYGVDFDQPYPAGAQGIRCESFELDAI